MNARNDIRFQSALDVAVARAALAAARLRLAAWVDSLVARWLERCATNAEAAQRLLRFATDPEKQA
jgi:hypothetical protein